MINVEQIGFSIFSLNNTCRACLCKGEEIIKMDTSEHLGKNLQEIFIAVCNIEVNICNPSEKRFESLSKNLCRYCRDKLIACYDFRMQCQNSNDIISNYAAKYCNDKRNALIERANCESISDETLGNVKSDDSNEELYNKKKKSIKKELKDIKQTMRLTQFSFDEVSQAIKDTRKKFFENTECIKCGFVSSNTRALSVHMMHLHKELKGRWCVQCNKELDNLTEHLQTHDNTDLKCQFCEKIFNSKGHFMEHLLSHSGVRPYKCDVCGKSFISQRHLKVHFRIHSNERPYNCYLCKKSFIQKSSLIIHLKQHNKDELDGDKHETNESQFTEDGIKGNLMSTAQNFCTECDKKVRSLVLHNQQYHDINQKVFNEYGDNVLDNKLCTVCGKQFKTASKLRIHMRVHTGETPYKCSYCEKRVSTRNQLVVHERIHTGEKPHVCHICGKGFAQSSVLNTHMRLHTGRPEVCKICDQRFCRPAELRLHMRKHTGEKPFLCTECGQAFIQRSHLVEHNKTHSEIRPFQCSYCEKAFKQNSSLKSHIQIHLGSKPFKCGQCPYACRQSYSLTQHMKQHPTDAPRPERPHMCLICNKTFTTVAMLSSHASATHNVQVGTVL